MSGTKTPLIGSLIKRKDCVGNTMMFQKILEERAFFTYKQVEVKVKTH